MTDIAQWLKTTARSMRPSGLGGPGEALAYTNAPRLDEAADEIEKLREWIKDWGSIGAHPDEVARVLGLEAEQ